MDPTAVDVVIPVYGPGPHLERVVAALRRQSPPVRRIIVSHSGEGDPTPRFTGAADVSVLHSPQRLFAGAARNRGMTLGQSDWVAFIDEDVIVDDAWHRALLAAIARGDAECLLGSIDCAESGGYWGTSLWFVEFGSYHPYRPRRAGYGGGSGNMAVHRETFLSTGGFPEDWRMAQDSYAQARMLERGYRSWFDPDIRAGHINLPGMRRALRHAYHVGRNSAKLRRVFPRLAGGRAVERPILSPGLWLIRLALVYRRTFAIRTAPILSLLVHTPGMLLVLLAWNTGFSREAFSRSDGSGDY